MFAELTTRVSQFSISFVKQYGAFDDNGVICDPILENPEYHAK